VPEALPTRISNAQPTGYGQSKLVAEHICMNAAARVGIPVYVLRIGQIIGDTIHGIWNSSEAIPLMMQTATTINTLPRIDEDLRWTPVDVVARAAIEITNSGAATGVFHLVNPRTVHWTRDILPYLRQAGLEFNVVDPSSWLKLLQASDDPVSNPPIKLFEYFKCQFDNNEATPRHAAAAFETAKSQRWSKTFADLQAPDQALVAKMVGHFIYTCWNTNPNPNPNPPAQQSPAPIPLRSVLAFSGAELISFAGAEFAAVDLVASLVSLRIGIPILDSSALGVGKNNTIIGSVALEEDEDEKDERKSQAPPISNGCTAVAAAAITIVPEDEIRSIPFCRTMFLMLKSADDDPDKSSLTSAHKNTDTVNLDVTGNWKDLIEEAEFWVRDFLRE
jgi:hypothetical protein